MQFRLMVAVFIFLGSYLPLSAILLAQDYDYAMLWRPVCWGFYSEGTHCTLPFRNPSYSLGIFAACFCCVALTLFVLALANPKQVIRVETARYIPSDLMNYTLPYVVAFMGINYNEADRFFGFLIFLGWMFCITYRSGQIILNPLFIIFGWRLYEISYKFPSDKAGQQHMGTALAPSIIAPGESYRQIAFQDVIILREATQREE